MVLSDFGRIAAQLRQWLAVQYPYVQLDEWVVMPDHVHGILVICDPDGGAPPPSTTRRKPLGQLIGAFKTVSAKQINQIRHTPGIPFWQRNFYDRIIRNDRELHAVRRYIANNPRRWEVDRENRT